MDEVRQIAQLYLAADPAPDGATGQAHDHHRGRPQSPGRKGFQPGVRRALPETHIDEKVKLPITNLWKAFTGFVVDVVDGEVDVRGE